jgi:hypothetical protein
MVANLDKPKGCAMLKPGEAAVLFIRRSEQVPDKYYVAVRRSETSAFNQQTHDFEIGLHQIPVTEIKDTTDHRAAVDSAIERLKSILGA